MQACLCLWLLEQACLHCAGLPPVHGTLPACIPASCCLCCEDHPAAGACCVQSAVATEAACLLGAVLALGSRTSMTLSPACLMPCLPAPLGLTGTQAA